MAVKEHFSHVGVWHLTYYAPDKSDDEVLMIFKDDPRIIAVQFNHEVSLRSNIEDKVTLYLKIIE